MAITEEIGLEAVLRGVGTYVAGGEQITSTNQRILASIGKVSTIAGLGLSAGITLPLVIAGGAALKFGLDFEKSLTQIAALTDTPRAAVQGMRNDLLDLAKATAISPADLGAGAYFILSSGIKDTSEAIQVLTLSAQASAVGLGDTKTIADVLTSVMNAYQLSTKDAAKATDTLINIVKFGKGEPAEFAAALGFVIPLAAQMGVSFEQVGAVLATLTNAGLNAAESVTALRGVLAQILSPAAKSKELFKAIGLPINEFRDLVKKDFVGAMNLLIERVHGSQLALATLFPDVRGLTGVLAAFGNQADQTKANLEGIEKGSGALNRAFAEVQKDPSFQLKQSFNELKVILTDLGAELVPGFVASLHTAEPFIERLGNLVSAFKELPSPVKGLIKDFAGFLIVLGPTLILIGVLSQGLKAFVPIIRLFSASLLGIREARFLTQAAAVGLESTGVAGGEAATGLAATGTAGEEAAAGLTATEIAAQGATLNLTELVAASAAVDSSLGIMDVQAGGASAALLGTGVAGGEAAVGVGLAGVAGEEAAVGLGETAAAATAAEVSMIPLLGILAIFIAAAAVGATAGILLAKNFDTLAATAGNVESSIEGFGIAIERGIIGGLTAAGDFVEKFWHRILFGVLVGGLGIAALTIIGNWDRLWKSFVEVASSGGGKLVDFYTKLWGDLIPGAIRTGSSFLINALIEIDKKELEILANLPKQAFELASKIPGFMAGGLASAAGDFFSAIGSFVKDSISLLDPRSWRFSPDNIIEIYQKTGLAAGKAIGEGISQGTDVDRTIESINISLSKIKIPELPSPQIKPSEIPTPIIPSIAEPKVPPIPEISVRVAEIQIPDIPDIKLPKIPDLSINVSQIKIPNIPEIKAPKLPEIRLSDIKTPEIEAPDIKLPKIPELHIDVSQIEIPRIPKIDLPKIPEISFDISKIDVPEVPKIQLPEIETPRVPGIKAPEVPKLKAPEIPEIRIPELRIPVKSPEIQFPEPKIPQARIPDLKVPRISEKSLTRDFEHIGAIAGEALTKGIEKGSDFSSSIELYGKAGKESGNALIDAVGAAVKILPKKMEGFLERGISKITSLLDPFNWKFSPDNIVDIFGSAGKEAGDAMVASFDIQLARLTGVADSRFANMVQAARQVMQNLQQELGRILSLPTVQGATEGLRLAQLRVLAFRILPAVQAAEKLREQQIKALEAAKQREIKRLQEEQDLRKKQIDQLDTERGKIEDQRSPLETLLETAKAFGDPKRVEEVQKRIDKLDDEEKSIDSHIEALKNANDVADVQIQKYRDGTSEIDNQIAAIDSHRTSVEKQNTAIQAEITALENSAEARKLEIGVLQARGVVADKTLLTDNQLVAAADRMIGAIGGISSRISSQIGIINKQYIPSLSTLGGKLGGTSTKADSLADILADINRSMLHLSTEKPISELDKFQQKLASVVETGNQFLERQLLIQNPQFLGVSPFLSEAEAAAILTGQRGPIISQKDLDRILHPERHRESGGPVQAGEPVIVGEHRPEVFVPSQSGAIVPSTSLFFSQLGASIAKSLSGITAGGGFKNYGTLQFVAETPSGQQQIDQIMRLLS